MKKPWLLLALGIVAFLVFAIATLPANVVLSRVSSPDVALAGVSGTIWKGRAQVVRVRGADLGGLQWDLHALALLTGRLTADAELKRTDGFSKTLVTVKPSGTIAFEDLSASMPLSALPPTLVRGGWTGKINLRFAELSLANGWPERADGAVELIDLTGPANRPVNVGSYKILFPPDATAGDTLAGALSDLGGPLQLTGTVQLNKANRGYLVQGLIAARNDAPQSIAKVLEALGPPDGEGRRPFGFEGTL